jgi:glycine/D-amino acid oxidase-like deaminating enzyme
VYELPFSHNMTTTTVILGAGIIGVSTAYYLSKYQPGSSIHLVEASPDLFASASGYAGGFLAKDWFSAATAELGALSFEEHRKLAEKDGGAEKWGYSLSTSLSLSPAKGSRNQVDVRGRHVVSSSDAVASGTAMGAGPEWIRRHKGDVIETIGEEGTTAQV